MNQLLGNPQMIDRVIQHVSIHFRRTYIDGIPLLHNDAGAFLSFTCSLMAIESLGALIKPNSRNADRFKIFVESYFPDPLRGQSQTLWEFRNAMVHVCSSGPYVLTHFNPDSPLTTDPRGNTVLNAEDFYKVLAQACERYFGALGSDAQLRSAFVESVKKTGVPVVKPLTG